MHGRCRRPDMPAAWGRFPHLLAFTEMTGWETCPLSVSNTRQGRDVVNVLIPYLAFFCRNVRKSPT